MLISAKLIRRPRKLRQCENIACDGWLHPGEPCVRLYGSATGYETPWAIYVHNSEHCVGEEVTRRFGQRLGLEKWLNS